MRIRLYIAAEFHGSPEDLVLEATIPDFKDAPGVVAFGSRLFTVAREQTEPPIVDYVEAFAFAVSSPINELEPERAAMLDLLKATDAGDMPSALVAFEGLRKRLGHLQLKTDDARQDVIASAPLVPEGVKRGAKAKR